jgi:hypothetical protein
MAKDLFVLLPGIIYIVKKIAMSSFKSTLKVSGKEFEILDCTFSFSQATDDLGRPSSDVRKGKITVDIVASADDSMLGWMVDPYKKVSGSIVFEQIDQASTLKEIKFDDAYCVGYSEHFNSTSSNPMTASVVISARKVTVGNAMHEGKW